MNQEVFFYSDILDISDLEDIPLDKRVIKLNKLIDKTEQDAGFVKSEKNADGGFCFLLTPEFRKVTALPNILDENRSDHRAVKEILQLLSEIPLNTYVAGGFITHLLFLYYHNEDISYGDVDIYVNGFTAAEFVKRFEKISGISPKRTPFSKDSFFANWAFNDYNFLDNNQGDPCSNYTWEFTYKGVNFQIVGRVRNASEEAFPGTIESTIGLFDFACCRGFINVSYGVPIDNLYVKASKRCRLSIKKKIFNANHLINLNTTSRFLRLLKYAKKVRWDDSINLYVWLVLCSMESNKLPKEPKANLLNKYVPLGKLKKEGTKELAEKYLELNTTVGRFFDVPWNPDEDAVYMIKPDAYRRRVYE